MTTGGKQDPSRPRIGRRPKMSAEDVEETMLSTAERLLLDYGLTVSLEHISMEALIADAGVPRSAVHRRWPHKELFFQDLLIRLVKRPESGTSVYNPATLRAALGTISNSTDALESAENRKKMLVEACRVGATTNFENILAAGHWRNYLMLSAAAFSFEGELGEQLTQTIRESETSYAEGMASFYQAIGKVLGWKVKSLFAAGSEDSHVSWLYLAHTGASLMEGMTLRHNVLPAAHPTIDPFDTGLSAKWSLPALAYTSCFLSLTEPDPDFDFAQVPRYLRECERVCDEIEREVAAAGRQFR